MRIRNRIALALFGFAMTGAKECTIDLPWDDSGNNDAPPPPPPICLTDPPVGCQAICVIVDPGDTGPPPPPPTPFVVGNCGDEGSGTLAALFTSDVNNTYTCDPAMYDNQSYSVFPTYFFITPVVAQTGLCTMPPLPPSTDPFGNMFGDPK